MNPPERWIGVDPGETTGWQEVHGETLTEGGQTPLWEFIDLLWQTQNGPNPYGLIVCEDWRLYPWKLDEMAMDPCRTARGIGAIEFIARRTGTTMVFQGANIKESAKAAGAENFYVAPNHPNRHQNDAIQHVVFWLARQGVRLA